MRRRPLLRAAAVSGGAYMAGRNAGQRRADQQYQDTDQNARISDLEQQQAAPPAARPPAAGPAAAQPAAEPSIIDQISQLAQLHQQGALTDDEFTTAKAKLLGS